MASTHHLMHSLLAATALAAAGIGITTDAQARTTGQQAGVSAARPLPLLRDAFYLQGTDFAENFDSYTAGSNVHGQGGWKGWFNDPNAGALVDDAFSVSPSNSVNISTTSDLIHEFSGYTSGTWVLTAKQYIPADYSGASAFILQNVYNDAGTGLSWSTQVEFDSVSGDVRNYADSASPGAMPYVTGQWVDLRLVIDLDADLQTFFYNGSQLYSGSWTGQFPGQTVQGILNIGALDLYAAGASPIYYDDILLTAGVPYAASLTSDPAAGSGAPGDTVTYTVTIENTGLEDDTYDLTAVGVQWTTVTSVPTIAVAAGASATFDVSVEIDPFAPFGAFDTAGVTAISQGDPLVQASVSIITTAVLGDLIFADGFELPPAE